MVEMVVNAMKAVSPEVICSSFKVCGIAPYGQDVPARRIKSTFTDGYVIYSK